MMLNWKLLGILVLCLHARGEVGTEAGSAVWGQMRDGQDGGGELDAWGCRQEFRGAEDASGSPEIAFCTQWVGDRSSGVQKVRLALTRNGLLAPCGKVGQD